MVELAEKEGVAERVADLYIRDLEERGVIHREGRSFRGGEQLILDYEQDVDREAFYAANEARRELLDAAGTALGEGRTLKYRRNSAENYTLRPWHEARGAAFMLQATGLGTLRETMGGNFDFELTARGYELAQDSSALSATFPTSRDEDIELSGSPSGPPAGETRVAGHGLDGRERDGRPGVFISYAHRDQAFVLTLVEELNAQGVRVWIDRIELAIGDSLVDRISEAIVEEDFLVAIVSEHSVQSGWCQREVALALTEGINNKSIKVLPVRLGDVQMPPSLRGNSLGRGW